MTVKSWFKNFGFRLRIFIWYMLTEPFRQIYGFLFHVSEALNKTKSWVYIVIFISTIALLVGNRPVAGLLFVLLLILIFLWEWNSGTFMYRYRQTQRRKIKKIVKEDEGEIKKW